MRTIYLTAIVVVLAVSCAQASVVTMAYYRGGETEGKLPGDTWSGVADASGRGIDCAGTVTATSNSPIAGSSVAYEDSVFYFAGGKEIFPSGYTNFQNWGIEGWFRPDSINTGATLMMIGRDNWGKGINIDKWNTNRIVCYFNGRSSQGSNANGVYITLDSEDVGQWMYIAVVNQDGVNTMYLNNDVVGTWVGSPDTSNYGSVTTQMEYGRFGFGIANQTHFDGAMDELRMFTFESGQFQTSDLLIPEPMTLGVLCLGGVAIVMRRVR